MKQYRSSSPIARCLDLLGDKWTLLIIRDIALQGKTTFKELTQMQEGIATNTLADRLEKLVKEEILVKTRSTRSKLVFHYKITPKGMDIIPIIQSMNNWAELYLFKDFIKDEKNVNENSKLSFYFR